MSFVITILGTIIITITIINIISGLGFRVYGLGFRD